MRRAGKVVRTANGLAVLRTGADPPTIGTDVVDERLDDAGTVVDVFGPVDRPYLAVSPPGRPDGLLGEALYVR